MQHIRRIPLPHWLALREWYQYQIIGPAQRSTSLWSQIRHRFAKGAKYAKLFPYETRLRAMIAPEKKPSDDPAAYYRELRRNA